MVGNDLRVDWDFRLKGVQTFAHEPTPWENPTPATTTRESARSSTENWGETGPRRSRPNHSGSLLHGGQHGLGRNRHVPHSRADRIVDRVGDGRRHHRGCWLADTARVVPRL